MNCSSFQCAPLLLGSSGAESASQGDKPRFVSQDDDLNAVAPQTGWPCCAGSVLASSGGEVVGGGHRGDGFGGGVDVALKGSQVLVAAFAHQQGQGDVRVGEGGQGRVPELVQGQSGAADPPGAAAAGGVRPARTSSAETLPSGPPQVVCDRGCAGYAAWAASRHSVLIVTADEGDDGSDNRIATIVIGAHVAAGRLFRTRRPLRACCGSSGL